MFKYLDACETPEGPKVGIMKQLPKRNRNKTNKKIEFIEYQNPPINIHHTTITTTKTHEHIKIPDLYKLKNDISKDPVRNTIIANKIIQLINDNKKVLVITKFISHGVKLVEQINIDDIFFARKYNDASSNWSDLKVLVMLESAFLEFNKKHTYFGHIDTVIFALPIHTLMLKKYLLCIDANIIEITDLIMNEFVNYDKRKQFYIKSGWNINNSNHDRSNESFDLINEDCIEIII